MTRMYAYEQLDALGDPSHREIGVVSFGDKSRPTRRAHRERGQVLPRMRWTTL
jgi:hypothetical protein